MDLHEEDAAPAAANSPVHSIFVGADGLRAGWGLLLWLILFTALIAVLTAIAHTLHLAHGGHSHELSARTSFLNEGVDFIAVLLCTAILARVERRPLTAYGLGGRHRLPQFLAGLAWGIVFLSILVVILKAAGLLVFDIRLLSGSSAWLHGLIWLAGFLLVALFEETMLRGYLQYTLARGLTGVYRALKVSRPGGLGFWTAAFLLSLVFGLGHGSNPGESPIGLLSAGVAGLVFCLSLWRTGSLWWAIGFHMTWDWAQSFLYGVADSGTMVQFHLWATHPVGKPLLSGGATGPEGSVLILPVMAVLAVVIVLTLPARIASPEANLSPTP